MVLRLIIISYIGFFLTGGLFKTYEKEVIKISHSVFNSKDIEFVNVSCPIGDLKKVFISNNENGYLFISSVSACSLNGCSSPIVNNDSNGEYFDMMVLINNDKNILRISILDYFSDYGYEITSKRYLNKFKGMNICDFSLQLDGINAITGATISSNALENKLSDLCDHLK